MKKGEVYTAKIGVTSFPDTGYVKIEDNTVELKKVIEGQEAEFVIVKKRKNRASARVLKTVKKSPLQTKEGCTLDGICGGCLYQSVEYDKQLEIKDRQMKALLDKANEDEFEIFENGELRRLKRVDEFKWEGVRRSPVSNFYRNKMEYSFGDEYKDGPLCLGMHKKFSTYDIVKTDICNIVHNDFNLILQETLEFFKEKGLPFYHKMRHEGFLRHLLIRRSVKNKELLLALVTTTDMEKCEDPNKLSGDERSRLSLNKDLEVYISDWKECMLALERKGLLENKIEGILHIVNNSYADAVLNQGMSLLYGKDYITEELLGLSFKISAFSFFQTNTLGAEVLYSAVGEYMGDTKGKAVFDLYSGTGTISQLLAKYADKVYGIEIVKEAVEAARENARLNKIDNCEFIAGDVLKLIDELEIKPDIIVLDPPRDGIHPKALPKIMNFRAERIVYVACKPSSFARDLPLLKAGGYVFEKALAVDMFPQTPNCELVAVLYRKDIDSRIEMKCEAEEGILDDRPADIY